MGCILSQPDPVQRNRRPIAKLSLGEEEEILEPIEPKELTLEETLHRDLVNILQGLQPIHVLEDLSPVVCLSENAMPLFLGNFIISEEDVEGITLPVCAISRVGNARFLVMGSHMLLAHTIITRTETSALIENAIIWGSDYRMKAVRIALVGFSNNLANSLANDLMSFGYVVELAHKIVKVGLNVDIIILPSSKWYEDIESHLETFAARGGAVFVFPDRASADCPNRFALNSFLSKKGLAFSECTLTPSTNTIKISDTNKLSDSTIVSVTERFNDLLNRDEDLTVSELDPVVSKLRYYVRALGPEGVEFAKTLIELSIDYIERTNYRDERGICPTDVHGIMSVMISELVAKIPAADIVPGPYCSVFPGLVGDDCLRLPERSLRFVVHRDLWVSTGLYLPPGEVAQIECSTSATIQIGSHREVLFLKPGPWLRWPLVMTRFEYTDKRIEIATPYGGILYIICTEPKNVMLTFSGFVRYPRYNIQKPAYWDATKDFDVPWCEIETEMVIFTLPSEEARKIRDVTALAKNVDRCVSEIRTFFTAKPTTIAQRIIFDVELPNDEPIIGDCIFVAVDLLPGLLIGDREATPDLLNILVLVAMEVMTPKLFDSEAQLAMATVAASHAIRTVWPDISPLEIIPGDAPRVFSDLWSVCERYGPNGLREAMKDYQLAKETVIDETDQDLWLVFVSELSKKVRAQLPELADRFRQLGKLSKMCSNKLNGYQLDDVDIP